MAGKRRVRLLHFNDVYTIEEAANDPVGGAARFATAVKEARARYSAGGEESLLLFSGDALSPSVMSSVTRGKHIVGVFNELGVSAACIGNHDFDFGHERLASLSKACNFPWMLANIVNEEEGNKPLSCALSSKIFTCSGVKVGVMGLAEDWRSTLPGLPEKTAYLDHAEVGTALAKEMREAGAELIVAVTHSREPEDINLARRCPDIDVILGGHDHGYYGAMASGVPLINSGTDFRDLTEVCVVLPEEPTVGNEDGDRHFELADGETLELRARRGVTVSFTRRAVTTSTAPDPSMEAIVEQSLEVMRKKMAKSLGLTSTVWDVTYEAARSKESNVGSLVCDRMCSLYSADLAIICGGTLRSGTTYGPGSLTMGDLMQILPFSDPVQIITLKGQHIWDALENGFSKLPALDGRFPQVGGIRVQFDPARPPGSRVVSVVVAKSKEPLGMDKVYKLATKPYLVQGGDGYDAFMHYEEMLVEDGVSLLILLRNYFIEMQVVDMLKKRNRVNNIVANAFRHTGKPKLPERLLPGPVCDGRLTVVGAEADR